MSGRAITGKSWKWKDAAVAYAERSAIAAPA
jgi:hypothetical protein